MITVDNIYVSDVVTLPGQSKQHSAKIYPWGNVIISLFQNGDYLKEHIQKPLKEWCNNSFVGKYELIYRFNNADPYWVLLCEKSEDFSLFMLRYGSLNKH